MIKVQVHSHETSIETIRKIGNVNDWMRKPIAEMLEVIHERIHIDGLASDGSEIGQYSTKPILIGKSSFIAVTNADKFFKSIKKSNKKKGVENVDKYQWVTYKGRKLIVLPGGYKRLRELNGRRDNDKVVLSLSGQLENDYAVIGLTTGYGIGFNFRKNTEIAKHLEEKYKKKIFAFTADEDDLFVGKIIREIDLIINGQ